MKTFPVWLKKTLVNNPTYVRTKAVLKELGINTVCQSSLCPNINECFGKSHLTFMILGNICTRDCKFCAVTKGKPKGIDFEEPMRIREAVLKLSLKHVIVTSVTRDDLIDGGAEQFANTIREVKCIHGVTVEVLTPDFKEKIASIEKVVKPTPDIFAHNIETVPRLYKEVRPKADYNLSLNLLKTVKRINKSLLTKSGLMLGLGEKIGEVLQVLKDLRSVDCDMVTLGQYLRPSKNALHIHEFISPVTFLKLKENALSYGFRYVESGPFVRSSYYEDKKFLTQINAESAKLSSLKSD